MKKYWITTYGCQMNVHDSENIAGILVDMGYVAGDTIENCDVVVFNTCCIRDNAETHAYGNIGALKSAKLLNKNMIIAVVGCMTQQEGAAEALKAKFKFIDIILGTSNAYLLGEKINEVLADRAQKRKKILDTFMQEKPQIIENLPIYRTSGTNAWVNIMYGCDNFCTYCIVPYVRGRERSRKPSVIIDEVRNLILDGYKEITLLGQNVNSYDSDGYNFAKLLSELAAIDGEFRLRFMTSHPKDFSDDIIDAIVSNKKIMPSIHLPVQSGSNAVLLAMNRRYTREHYFDIINKIRTKIPNCGITSDIMVGFPTETEEDFLQTLDLVKRVKFSSAFTFIYSPRRGTVASKMAQLPYAVKKDRISRLIAVQNDITLEVSHSFIGKTVQILVENVAKNNKLAGRTECGRLVTFVGNKNIVGQFATIKIIDANASQLKGELITNG